MKIVLSIGKLATAIEAYKNIKLENNKEVDICELNIAIPVPSGQVIVDKFIKKFDLPMLCILLENNYRFNAAETHIVRRDGVDTFLKNIAVGDMIEHRDGFKRVLEVTVVSNEDCYDISIPSPHLYYDANGVVHHNTITTATLSKLCEAFGRTVTVVPNKSLVEQTEEDFVNCGLDVGVYYGDRKDLNRTHTICTWQSLNILDKKSKEFAHDSFTLAEFLDGVKTVMVDECHMAKAEVLKNLLTQNLQNACVRWGLTGTVPKEKYESESIFASLGPVINSVKAHTLQDSGVLAKCHVNVVQMVDIPEFKSYQDELKYLVTDDDRMIYISNLIKKIAETGNTLVLVNRIESGKFLVNEIPDSVFISGEVKSKDRKAEYDEVKVATNKIIVATFGVAAVGINIPRIFNLVLLEPGKSFVRVIQSIGRGIRKADDKDFVQIWDITSTCKFAKRHLTERKKFYKDAKYDFTLEKVKW